MPENAGVLNPGIERHYKISSSNCQPPNSSIEILKLPGTL